MTGRKQKKISLSAVKIPESVEKFSDTRKALTSETADAMIDALNSYIEKHDLTFEEAFHASFIVFLSLLNKYLHFVAEKKLTELQGRYSVSERRAGIA